MKKNQKEPPDNWKTKTLGCVGKFSKGKGLSKKDINSTGKIKAIPYTSIYTDFKEVINYDKINRFTSSNNTLIINSPHLLIAGSSNMLENIGKTTAYDAKKSVAVGGDVIVFKTDENVSFLSNLLNTFEHRNKIVSLSQGSTIRHVYPSTFENYEVIIPNCKDEQSTIAKNLSDISELIQHLDYLITKKKNIMQGTMQKLLTGKIRLKGFKEKWSESTLEQNGVFTKGKGIKKTEVADHGLSCIRYGEIYTKYNVIVNETISRIPLEITKKSQKVKEGDLLFTGSGETADEIGKCIVYQGKKPCYAGGDILIFSGNKNDPLFFAFLLNSENIQKQKSSMAQGDMVVHIYASSLKKLKIKIPDIPEQQKISKTLFDMRLEIQELESKRDKYIMIKNGMMQKLLTGEIRLV